MDTSVVLLLLVMMLGLFGVIVPMLPGMGIIFAAVLVYGFYSGWLLYSPFFAIVCGILTVISFAVDYLSGVYGAKKYGGASKEAMIAALVGGIIGMVIFSFIGMILGSALGIFAVEYYHNKKADQSAKAAIGVLIGTAIGIAVQFALALIVICWVVYKIIIVF